VISSAPVTHEGAIEIVAAVAELFANLKDLFENCGAAPSARSPAEAELRSFPSPKLVQAAYSQGGILIEAAADHAVAFVRTATEPVLTVAPWACVRAQLEACALAAWLLDPALEVRSRVQRSLAFRYEGLSQQRALGNVARDPGSVAKATARIDGLERTSLDLGYPQLRNQKGERDGVAQRMPSITRLIAETLDEEVTYRLLSALAHGHPWALTQASFEALRTDDANVASAAGTDEDTYPIKKSLNTAAVGYLCVIATTSLARPVTYRCKLFGWDTDRVREICGSAVRKIGPLGHLGSQSHHSGAAP